uniref:Hexosyltransferase n=1 Tax=Equus asinus asinus TaxID=83772 RepID=A0A8C4MGL9_EQUAS
MGGPGMIFSREVLRRMVPHIGECLREMYTTHEDVEVGRCVRRFGGTQCVWSYEIAGTCHEKEQEIILRCSLRCCPKFLGKNFQDALFDIENIYIYFFGVDDYFHRLSVHTAINLHSHSSHFAWCSPKDRGMRLPVTQISR